MPYMQGVTPVFYLSYPGAPWYTDNMKTLDAYVRAIFDAMNEGIVIIDLEGRIVYCNSAYSAFIGADPALITGCKLRELRPGARLPEVLVTGEPILHAPRREGNDDVYFVNMYPVYENRHIVGDVSVVTFIRDAFDASKELERVEKLSRQILHRVNKTNTVHYSFDSIVAESPAAKECKEIARKAATTDATVMLLSESGTGKELYAQAIHSASARRKEPFVAVNCANFNGTMMESELFGYVEGAFTGAKKGGRIGLFEAANGGTLFLDEVSEIEIPLQAKLLRALQEGRIRPVGGVEEKEIDVRVISASNADMEERITQGSFRTDLFYRLSTFQIRIPPLRKRRLCIPALTRDILDELSGKLHTGIKITDEAMRALMGYDWPGNIRELRNVLELSAYFAEDGTVTRRSLPDQIIRNSANAVSERLSDRVKRFEKEEILRLLKVNGNTLEGKKKTAKELGISLSSLYNKIGDGI